MMLKMKIKELLVSYGEIMMLINKNIVVIKMKKEVFVILVVFFISVGVLAQSVQEVPDDVEKYIKKFAEKGGIKVYIIDTP